MTGKLLDRYYAWYEERAKAWNQPAQDELRELDDSKLEYLRELGVLEPRISGFHFPNVQQWIEQSQLIHIANEALACAWLNPHCSLAIGSATRGKVPGWQAIVSLHTEPFEIGSTINSYTTITHAQYEMLMECMLETQASPPAVEHEIGRVYSGSPVDQGGWM